MDPSYNNSFGRSASGGASGGSVASGGGVVPGGGMASGNVTTGGGVGIPGPVASGAGDIVLSGGIGPKKSRKWLVIGIIAAVVVLVGVGIWAVTRRSGSGDSYRETEVAKQYLNYVVNGDVNEATATDTFYDEWTWYYLNGVINADDDEFDAFYIKANAMLDEMAEAYGEDEDGEKDEEMLELVAQQKALLELYRIDRKIRLYDTIYMIDRYNSGDEYNDIRNAIVSGIEELGSDDGSYVSAYVELTEEWLSEASEAAQLFQSYECDWSSMAELPITCATSEENMVVLNTLINKAKANYDEKEKIVDLSISSFVNAAYSMADDSVIEEEVAEDE